jgi:hypothetical protein
MIWIRLISIAALVAILSSCTITQTSNPVAEPVVSGAEICVVEKLDVREDFRSALITSLRQRNFRIRPLKQGTAYEPCPLALSYNAKYSWDFVMYMAWAELTVYKKGTQVGDALYSAPTGGWSMTTRIYESTQSKVDTMVSQLFPD